MGVVYYSNYLVWFEICRTEYFRSLGYPYVDLERKKIFLPVLESYCRYKSSLTYDDEARVYLTAVEIKGIKLTFKCEVENKRTNQIAASGYTKHVFIDQNNKPIKIPVEILKLIR